MLIGYARVSTQDQNEGLQIDALKKAGCEKIFVDKASGADRERPELASALSYVRGGDTLVCWKLDRIARSLSHLLQVTESLAARDATFQSLTETIDTSTPMGKMMFHLLGAFAEFERSLISERITAGLAARRKRGKKLGPKFKHPLAIVDHLIPGTRAQQADALGIDISTLHKYLRRRRRAPLTGQPAAQC